MNGTDRLEGTTEHADSRLFSAVEVARMLLDNTHPDAVASAIYDEQRAREPKPTVATTPCPDWCCEKDDQEHGFFDRSNQGSEREFRTHSTKDNFAVRARRGEFVESWIEQDEWADGITDDATVYLSVPGHPSTTPPFYLTAGQAHDIGAGLVALAERLREIKADPS